MIFAAAILMPRIVLNQRHKEKQSNSIVTATMRLMSSQLPAATSPLLQNTADIYASVFDALFIRDGHYAMPPAREMIFT
jgi:hypothetical protein